MKKIWTIPQGFSHIPCIHEWVLLDETDKSFIVQLYGGRKTIRKENLSYFCSKEAALQARKDLIREKIDKLTKNMSELLDELWNPDRMILEPHEAPPRDVNLGLKYLED